MRFSLALAAALLLAGCQPAGRLAPPSLVTQSFGHVKPREVRTLIVVLHDDAAPGTRSDEVAFARAAAAAIPLSAAVTVLRPGFRNAAGTVSPGEAAHGYGEGYGLDQVHQVASAIDALRRRYRNARTVVVGDSGGAALAANIAAIRPGVLDGVVLVGCPCSLPEWRAHMAKRSGDAGWKQWVESFDPLKTAGGIPPTLRAAVLVGAEDQVTPVRFSRAYAEALTLRGIATDYRIVPGKGHDLLGDPAVLAATRRLAAELPGEG